MPPDIPLELYCLFVDQIALEQDIKIRIETLKASSLAFRALSHQTRRYLFYRIKFQPKINTTDSIQHFCQFLEGNPRSDLISYLRVLEIESELYAEKTDTIHGLPTILNVLCADERGPLQLHTLKVAMRGAKWKELARDLRDSLYAAVTCRHLTVPTSGLKELEFIRIMNIPMSFFAQCTQTVKVLRFNNCSFVDSLPIVQSLSAHAACNPRLRLEVYGYLDGFSKGLQVNLDSPAATNLARIKHLALGYCMSPDQTMAIPSILLMTKGHLETLELRKISPFLPGFLGMFGPINLTAHRRLRRFIFEPAGVNNLEVFELETDDPTSIEDIEIHIRRVATHPWQKDLCVEVVSRYNWKNLDGVLLGPRYPLLRKVDIIVFLKGPFLFQSPASVQTDIVQELRALLSNLSTSRKIQLEVAVRLGSLPD